MESFKPTFKFTPAVSLVLVAIVVLSYAAANSLTSDSALPPHAIVAESTSSIVREITMTTETELRASDAAESDQFGGGTVPITAPLRGVSVSETVALVGAYKDDNVGTDSGSAYVFRHDGSTWVQEQKLVASDAAAYDKFGGAVAIDGNVAVVGAFGDNNSAGSAYVFRYNGSTWVEEQKLVASDGASLDWFGGDVAVSGNTIVVGAYRQASYRGSAYVFHYNGTTWTQQQKLLATDGVSGDRFGFSVSVYDDVALLGAYTKKFGTLSSVGAAYVFRYNGSTWIQEQKFLPNDTTRAYQYFGNSVSFFGNLAVVGAYQDADLGLAAGSAYVFRFGGSTWASEGKLYASDAAQNDYFGFSVSAGDETVAVGAPNSGRSFWNLTDGEGAVYVFRNSGASWVQEYKLLATDGVPSDLMGGVSLSGDSILAGVPNHTHTNTPFHSGAAYVFDLAAEPADTTAPSVSLTAPTAGATLLGMATLAADATDNVGVTLVEFYHGSTLVGVATSDPYTYDWNTLTVPNGSYQLTARAYDEAENVGVSGPINITVANDCTTWPPGTSCSDGNRCTVSDRCRSDGTCRGSTKAHITGCGAETVE